jgi:hypothetical protein
MEEDKMDRACGTYRRIREIYDGFFWENLKERNHSEGIGIN